jgi:hypothetical protein
MKKYKLREDLNAESIPLEITEGKYQGYVFTIGKIHIKEENDNLLLDFTYDIVEGDISDIPKSEFDVIVGDVIVELLTDEEARIGKENLDVDGEDHTEESGDE